MFFSGIVLALLALVTLDFYVTAAKISFINARLARLLSFGEQNHWTTGPTIALLKQRIKIGASLQILHVILRFWLAGLLLTTGWVPITASLAWLYWGLILLLAAIVLSFGEQQIETRVLDQPETWAFRLTFFTKFILTIFTPILFIPLTISRSIAAEPQRFFSVTEDELRKLLDASQEEGVLEKEERRLIHS
ncbi:MAG: DUF21 domain-containing protein, partial [Anaerolineales bacterium]|nr:DUF21 domain-containing protein [Anaerolineales bacterium]